MPRNETKSLLPRFKTFTIILWITKKTRNREHCLHEPLVIASDGEASEREKVAMTQAPQELHVSVEIVVSFIEAFHFSHQTSAAAVSELGSVRRNLGIAVKDSVETVRRSSNVLIRNSPHKKHRTWTIHHKKCCVCFQFDKWIRIYWNWDRIDRNEGGWSENWDYRSEIGGTMREGGDGACGWRDPWLRA